MPNLIALAIPLFFLGVFLEVWVARRRRVSVHRLGDVLADMGCGMTQQLAAMFSSAALLAGLLALYEHRLCTLSGWWVWPVAFVGVDFVYYWWHRWSHEVNFLWAAHGVHHQSEDYNLAVALRQSVFTTTMFFPFLAVLVLVGVPLLHIGVVASLHNLYQFWIHTELIGKLGPLESLINTPSLHRVHHAINPQYLDRNHGGTLMVWDHLFGTYQAEEGPCVYGMTRPLASYNPLWAQVDGYWYMLRLARHAPNLREVLKVFYKSPAWRAAWFPDIAPTPVRRRAQQRKYDPQAPLRSRVWAVVQFAVLVVATIGLLRWGASLAVPVRVGAVVLIYLALISVCALLEGPRWARRFEAIRWGLMTAAIAVFVVW
jgi:alkylglycerol monooxygenase